MISFASITAAGFVLGQISGLVREMVVSAHFGLSAELDAFFIARLVPTLVNNIVAGSAISAAVMPIFARELTQGARAEFWRIASVITNFVLLVSGGLTIAGILLASPIISIVGGGLAPATQTMAIDLLIIMMPTLLLSAALNMLTAMLNSVDRFVGPALIFLALNMGIIATVFVLSSYVGIYSVGIGFLIGVILQVVIQIIELRMERPQYSWRLDFKSPALRQLFLAFLPITALSIVAQINLVVDRSMAASLVPGSVGALSYADTLLGAFYMLGISLSIAVFPSLSRMAAVNDLASTARTIVASLRMLIFVLTPVIFVLIGFGAPIVGLVLGRGRFDEHAIQMTAQALGAYALGLIGIAALYVLQRAFFALADNLTPLIVGIVAAILHFVLNLILMLFWAHAGLALSTSITALLSASALVILLKRRMGDIRLTELIGFIFRCAIFAAVCFLGLFWIFDLMHFRVETMGERVLGVVVAIASGVIYFLLSLATRTPESFIVLQTVRGYLQRGR